MSTHARWSGSIFAAALAIAGCAHGRVSSRLEASPATPPRVSSATAHVSSQLEAARVAMSEARTAGAAELEPGELADAERAIELAEAESDGSPREAHFAYIAERRARRAMADVRRDRIERGMALDTHDLEEAECGVATLDAELLFDRGGTELRPDAAELLAPIVEELRVSGAVAVVAGFTDARGSIEDNRDLSQRRADAVRAYLIAQGVPEASLVAEGRGASSPIASNDTVAGRAMNRRVEISIYPTIIANIRPAPARVALATR